MSVCTSVAQGLYGATLDAGLPFAREAAADVGSVMVSTLIDGHAFSRLCTAVRVGPGTALTALHCLRGEVDWAVEVSWRDGAVRNGTPGACEESGARAAAWQAHPTLDLALLTFEEEGDSEVRGRPIALQDPAIGEEVLLAGYGLSETGGLGRRRFLPSTVRDLSDGMIVVDSGQGRGACTGDSGGPLLQTSPSGVVSVAGILSRGSPDCQGRDEYTSLVGALEWIHVGLHPTLP